MRGVVPYLISKGLGRWMFRDMRRSRERVDNCNEKLTRRPLCYPLLDLPPGPV